MMNSDNCDREFLQKYAWDYFSLHAAQRLTSFNFYVIMCGLILAAYASVAKGTPNNLIQCLLGVMLCLISFVFWKLDGRNRQLIHNAEDALKDIEDRLDVQDTVARPHILKIFRYEESQTREMALKGRGLRWWPRPFKYSTCFHVVFVVMSIVGVMAAIYPWMFEPDVRAHERNVHDLVVRVERLEVGIGAHKGQGAMSLEGRRPYAAGQEPHRAE